jgi:hypothetical protein
MTTTTTTTTAATTGAAACMGTSTCEAVEEWQDIKEEQPAAAAEQQQSSWLPPGFRFHPTDEELVSYYLAKKVRNGSFAGHAIAEVDLNKCEPWDLPEKAKMGEREWYFFSLRDRKYPTGMRTNRATDAGYWKATGKDRDVMSSSSSGSSRSRSPPQLVGMKKTLVFYMGRAPKGEKTNWIMHEYRLEGDHSCNNNTHHRGIPKDEWVVCRIFQKSVGGKKISGFGYPSDLRFLEAISHYHHHHQQQQQQLLQLDETRSSSTIPITALMDHSPNPTVATATDDAAAVAAAANLADCEMCAAAANTTNNYDHTSGCMSNSSSLCCCFHNYSHDNTTILQASSSPNFFFNHKENTAPAGTWAMKSSAASPKSSGGGGGMMMSLPTTMHSAGTTAATMGGISGMEMIHQAAGGGALMMNSSSMAKLCPNHELSFIDPNSAAKSNVSIMPRMDFASSQQQQAAAVAAAAYLHTNLMLLKSLDPVSLRAKAEPYYFEGNDDEEDEAQSNSIQKVLSYGWGFEQPHHQHPILNEQLNLTATTTTPTTEASSCVTPNLFRYNNFINNNNNNNTNSKFGFADSSVDLECMF